MTWPPKTGRPWSPPPGPLALPRTLGWCGPGAATRGSACGVAGGAVFGCGAWGTRLGSSWLSCWIYGDFFSQLCGNLNIKAVIWGISMEKNSYICCVFFLGGMIPHSIHGIFVYLRVDFNENPTIDLFFFGGWPVDLPFHGAPKSSKTASVNSPWRGASFPSKFPSINLCEVYPPQNQQQKPLKMDVVGRRSFPFGAISAYFQVRWMWVLGSVYWIYHPPGPAGCEFTHHHTGMST